jgi:hypothetical protein
VSSSGRPRVEGPKQKTDIEAMKSTASLMINSNDFPLTAKKYPKLRSSVTAPARPQAEAIPIPVARISVGYRGCRKAHPHLIWLMLTLYRVSPIILNEHRSFSREAIQRRVGRRSGTLCFDHPRSLFSVAARRSMACPTASRPMRVTAP